MRKKLLEIAIAAGLFVVVNPTFAQEISGIDLGKILLPANDPTVPEIKGAVNVKVVNPVKAVRIPEILCYSAGSRIQKRMAIRANEENILKLRGFDACRFTIMLNGHPINEAGVMGGLYNDWAAIPLNTVEKIQIVKGGKVGRDGNTLGGTINIITCDRKPNDRESDILNGSNGRYDYRFNYVDDAEEPRYPVDKDFLSNNDYDDEQYRISLNYDAGRNSFVFEVSRREVIVTNNVDNVNYDPSCLGSGGTANLLAIYMWRNWQLCWADGWPPDLVRLGRNYCWILRFRFDTIDRAG